MLQEKQCRSSHRRFSIKKLFLKVLQCLQENTCVGSLFLIKACNFVKERLQQSCFSANITKFLRAPFCRTSANGCSWQLAPLPLKLVPLTNLKNCFFLIKRNGKAFELDPSNGDDPSFQFFVLSSVGIYGHFFNLIFKTSQ